MFYSVAQHSVYVANQCERFRLEGLMHDAAEAYIGDMVRGLKIAPELAGYREVEQRIERAIATRFGLVSTYEVHAEIDNADSVMLFTEARDLMKSPPNAWKNKVEPLPDVIVPWTSMQAEEEFLFEFMNLIGAKHA